MMENFGISYQQLLETPYEKYLDFRRIARLEAKEEKKQMEKQKKQADRKT